MYNWPTYEGKTVSPSYLEVDSKRLLVADNFIKTRLKNVTSALIIKDGFIIFEKYYNNYYVNTKSHIASITKCILSSLVGIAIKEGLIKNTSHKVVDFFPEYKFDKKLINIQSMTLHHLLTMTSGIVFDDIRIINKNPNWIKFVLELQENEKPGKFIYNDLNAHLLSVIISKLANMDTYQFALNHLFQPLDIEITPSDWLIDAQGYCIGGWGLSLSARNMAKIGLLFLNKGFCDGIEIIPQNWVENAIKEHLNIKEDNRDETGYGYFWWLCDNMNEEVYFARGKGEQYIINCPKTNTTTVFKTLEDSQRINLFKFWKLYLAPYI